MRSSTGRLVLQVVAAVCPQVVKRFIYRRAFGWSIDRSARLGISLFAVDHLVVEAGVQVSHFNVFKGCERVHLGRGAAIGPLNWITAAPTRTGLLPQSPDRRPELWVGPEAGITTRHYIQCNDEVRLGELATLGGLHSRIVTHGPDISLGVQIAHPVTIGDRSLVATNCTLLAGAVIPPRSVVGAGATVTGPLEEELWLYGGTPARPIKRLDADAGLFRRTRGYMD